MRDYWHNQDVDNFVTYLAEKGFYIAWESYSTNNLWYFTPNMATRLNYEHYLANSNKEVFEAIFE